MFSDTLAPEQDPHHVKLPKFSPDELIGLTFLHELDDGQKYRAEIVKRINDMDSSNHKNIKFLIKYGDPSYEEIIAYTELCDILEQQHLDELSNQDKLFTYKRIVTHIGPLKPTDPNYKGSTYNVRVEWEDGSITDEPLTVFSKDDPLAAAKYAKTNDLLETTGWKHLKRIANRPKKMKRMLSQAVLKAKRDGPIWKFGVQVPRSTKQAYELDQALGQTKWADAIEAERSQLFEYGTFESKGLHASKPQGYKMIHVFFIFDVKHDLQH